MSRSSVTNRSSFFSCRPAPPVRGAAGAKLNADDVNGRGCSSFELPPFFHCVVEGEGEKPAAGQGGRAEGGYRRGDVGAQRAKLLKRHLAATGEAESTISELRDAEAKANRTMAAPNDADMKAETRTVAPRDTGKKAETTTAAPSDSGKKA